MTDREKAIVMAYTGICMLEGEKLFEFYAYLEELYARPVYTHELLTLNIKERSEKDFMELCRNEESERKTGKWVQRPRYEGDTQPMLECPFCQNQVGWWDLASYCNGCGARLEGGAA